MKDERQEQSATTLAGIRKDKNIDLINICGQGSLVRLLITVVGNQSGTHCKLSATDNTLRSVGKAPGIFQERAGAAVFLVGYTTSLLHS